MYSLCAGFYKRFYNSTYFVVIFGMGKWGSVDLFRAYTLGRLNLKCNWEILPKLLKANWNPILKLCKVAVLWGKLSKSGKITVWIRDTILQSASGCILWKLTADNFSEERSVTYGKWTQPERFDCSLERFSIWESWFTIFATLHVALMELQKNQCWILIMNFSLNRIAFFLNKREPHFIYVFVNVEILTPAREKPF